MHRLMLHHHPMLHSYNITRGHPVLKINKQRHCNILKDPHEISNKTDNFWMYNSQITSGCYVFKFLPNVTPMFYLYHIQNSLNILHIMEMCSS